MCTQLNVRTTIMKGFEMCMQKYERVLHCDINLTTIQSKYYVLSTS